MVIVVIWYFAPLSYEISPKAAFLKLFYAFLYFKCGVHLVLPPIFRYAVNNSLINFVSTIEEVKKELKMLIIHKA